jgi:hypothetical protein
MIVLMLAAGAIAASSRATLDVTGALSSGSPLTVLHMPPQLWSMLLSNITGRVPQQTSMVALLALPTTGSTASSGPAVSYALYLLVPQLVRGCNSSLGSVNSSSTTGRLLGAPPLITAQDDSSSSSSTGGSITVSAVPSSPAALLVPLQCATAASSGTTPSTGLLCARPTPLATAPSDGALLITQADLMSLLASLAAASTDVSANSTATPVTKVPGAGLSLEESGQVVTVAATPAEGVVSGGNAGKSVHADA